MFFRATILAALAALAAASPLVERQSTGYLMSVDSPKTPVKASHLNANSAGFYNGRPTHASCPTGVDCSGFPNTTTVDFGSPRMGLYANVPGGQDIYVASTGALMFTEPHTEGVFPVGAFVKSFANTGGFLEFTGHGSKGWALCNDNGQVYALIANNGCGSANQNPIKIKLTATKALGAFQYE